MKKILFVLFILTSIIFASDVDAGYCDYSELSRLKSIASNINISYEYTYDLSSDDVKFSIRFDNLNEDILIEDSNKSVYLYNGSSFLVLNGFDDGIKYKFKLYTDKTNCINKDLIINYVNLPKYNQYYNDDICKGLSDYYMCQMWYQHDLTKSEFIKKIEEYKKEVNPEPVEPTDIVKNIFDFIYENYYYFAALSVIIILIIIYTRSRNNDFDLNT